MEMCKMSFLLLGQWPPSGFDLNFKSDILAKTFVFTFIVHIELGQFLFILYSFSSGFSFLFLLFVYPGTEVFIRPTCSLLCCYHLRWRFWIRRLRELDGQRLVYLKCCFKNSQFLSSHLFIFAFTRFVEWLEACALCNVQCSVHCTLCSLLKFFRGKKSQLLPATTLSVNPTFPFPFVNYLDSGKNMFLNLLEDLSKI